MRVILAALVLLTIPTADWELLGTRRVSFKSHIRERPDVFPGNPHPVS